MTAIPAYLELFAGSTMLVWSLLSGLSWAIHRGQNSSSMAPFVYAVQSAVGVTAVFGALI